MKKIDILILLFILIVAIGFRLYKIDIPLADLHSWRQVDTAAVARNFTKTGIDLLHPRYDDLSSIQSGIENPNGIRMVELPIYSAIFSALYKYLPIFDLEVYGRITTAFFSLIIILIIYYIALHEKNRIAAISAALIYSIFPFFVYFSRIILPETTATAFMFISIFILYRSLKKNKFTLVETFFSALFFAISILTKPTTIFYSFTALYLFVFAFKFEVVKQWKMYLFFILGFVPFILWRYYILQYPEGIPASSWLISQVNTFEGPKEIFFRPAFFRWIFMERIGIAMFGLYGLVFLFLGSVWRYKNLIFQSIMFSGYVYLFVFQGGNVQHEYYQTIALPMFAMIAGVGVSNLIGISSKHISKLTLYPFIFITMVLAIVFSFYKVKDYYNYPSDLVSVAGLIKTFTQPNDKIVTDRSGDTTLLYLADRKGAPAVYKSVEELKSLGYNYLITSNKGLQEELKSKNLKTIFETNLYLMVML